MPRPLRIAGRLYASKADAIREARRVLHDGVAGSEIAKSDEEFVEALLSARADKMLDLHGLNVVRYERNWQDVSVADRTWTMCFWAILEDGSRVDFSFMKAIDLLAGLSC